MDDKISVLIAARKDSKYLAKFLFGLLENTADLDSIEVLVMVNAHDTWNEELIHYFSDFQHSLNIQFFYENDGLGRGGLHEYFNNLYKHATGDWVVYFCEDHFINVWGWDLYVSRVIDGRQRGITSSLGSRERDPLDPGKPWVIVPKFDNAGAMNHILSRGFIEAIGALGKHGWIDSYINDLCIEAFGDDPTKLKSSAHDIVIKLDDEIFHDFTHDLPNPLDPVHNKTELSGRGLKLPKYGDPRVTKQIAEDAKKLREVLK